MPLDVSDVHAFTRRVEAEFDAMPMAVFGFVEAGADILVNTDPYQNRTGDLRTSTQAVNVDDELNGWHFDLEMGMKYASYVRDLGFSEIDDIAMVVRDHINVFLTSDMTRRIGGF